MGLAYGEQFELYLTAHKRCSAHTVQSYMRDVRAFLAFQARKKGAKINDSAVAAYLWHLKKRRGLSARSIARAIASLRSFFTFLQQEHVPFDVCVERITVPKQRGTIPSVVNEGEIARLLRALQHDQTKHAGLVRALVFLLYGTGMRVSELVKLTLSDVHFDERLIKVHGKGAKERLIPISEPFTIFVLDYINRVRPALLGEHESDFLFAHCRANRVRPFSRQDVWYQLSAFGKKHGMRLYPHIMRHSMATHLLRNGVDLRSLQVLLGHEQVTTTQVYTHVDIHQLREVYDAKHLRKK